MDKISLSLPVSTNWLKREKRKGLVLSPDGMTRNTIGRWTSKNIYPSLKSIFLFLHLLHIPFSRFFLAFFRIFFVFAYKGHLQWRRRGGRQSSEHAIPPDHAGCLVTFYSKKREELSRSLLFHFLSHPSLSLIFLFCPIMMNTKPTNLVLNPPDIWKTRRQRSIEKEKREDARAKA